MKSTGVLEICVKRDTESSLSGSAVTFQLVDVEQGSDFLT